MSIRNEIVDAIELLFEENRGADGERQKLILPSEAEIDWIPRMERVGSEVVIGGQIEVIKASGVVLRSAFVDASNTVITVDSDVILADNSTGRPRAGTGAYRTTGFRGKRYRVLQVGDDATEAYFLVDLGSAK